MQVTIPLEDKEAQALFAECEPGEELILTVTVNNGTSIEGELEKGDYEEEAEPVEEEAPAPSTGKKLPKAVMMVVGK